MPKKINPNGIDIRSKFILLTPRRYFTNKAKTPEAGIKLLSWWGVERLSFIITKNQLSSELKKLLFHISKVTLTYHQLSLVILDQLSLYQGFMIATHFAVMRYNGGFWRIVGGLCVVENGRVETNQSQQSSIRPMPQTTLKPHCCTSSDMLWRGIAEQRWPVARINDYVAPCYDIILGHEPDELPKFRSIFSNYLSPRFWGVYVLDCQLVCANGYDIS